MVMQRTSVERSRDKKKLVYVLQNGFGKYGDTDRKMIGVFDTKKAALDATKFLRSKPGFRGTRSRFSLDRYEIDKIYWAEGFIT